MGPRLGHHHPHLRLHQPHPHAGGAGNLAGQPVRGMLPRHLQIIYEINQRFLQGVMHRFPGDTELLQAHVDHRRRPRPARPHGAPGHRRQPPGQRRGANPHRADEATTIFADFDRFYPGKIINITNGITPRRWLNQANPGLAATDHARASATAGSPIWTQLRQACPAGRRQRFPGRIPRREAAPTRKSWPAILAHKLGIWKSIPTRLFDVQIKRIHEYKRQLLNVLHVVTLYNRIRANPRLDRGAAHRDLRRQGGARLRHGQADHQADQRRGRHRQQRPGYARPAQGGVHSQLRRLHRERNHPRRRSVASRYPPPAPKPPAPAT